MYTPVVGLHLTQFAVTWKLHIEPTCFESILCTAASALTASRQASTTCAPAPTTASAVSKPSPVLPPVITTTLPLKSTPWTTSAAVVLRCWNLHVYRQMQTHYAHILHKHPPTHPHARMHWNAHTCTYKVLPCITYTVLVLLYGSLVSHLWFSMLHWKKGLRKLKASGADNSILGSVYKHVSFRWLKWRDKHRTTASG